MADETSYACLRIHTQGDCIFVVFFASYALSANKENIETQCMIY